MRIKKIRYTSKFARRLKKIPPEIQKRALKNEEIFRKNPFDQRLKTHKLKGNLKDFYSFSVGYKYRILFSFENKDKAAFIDVGSHKIYQ